MHLSHWQNVKNTTVFITHECKKRRSVNIAVTQSLLSGQVVKVGSLRFKPNMKCKTIFIVYSFEGVKVRI